MADETQATPAETPGEGEVLAPLPSAPEGPHAIFGGSVAPAYIAPDDVYEKLEDGRVIQIAVKGQGLPLGKAVELGLVNLAPVGPSEIKEQPFTPGATRHIGAPPVEPPKGEPPAGGERSAPPAKGKK